MPPKPRSIQITFPCTLQGWSLNSIYSHPSLIDASVCLNLVWSRGFLFVNEFLQISHTSLLPCSGITGLSATEMVPVPFFLGWMVTLSQRDQMVSNHNRSPTKNLVAKSMSRNPEICMSGTLLLPVKRSQVFSPVLKVALGLPCLIQYNLGLKKMLQRTALRILLASPQIASVWCRHFWQALTGAGHRCPRDRWGQCGSICVKCAFLQTEKSLTLSCFHSSPIQVYFGIPNSTINSIEWHRYRYFGILNSTNRF